MLETVKSFLRRLPDIEFEYYYNEYMMQVQDRGIHDEVDATLRNHGRDVLDICEVLNSEYERLDNEKLKRIANQIQSYV